MYHFTNFMAMLTARPRPAAEPARLNRLEAVFDVRLPDEFRQLYLTADGFEVPRLRVPAGYDVLSVSMEFEPLAEIEKYAGVFPACLGVVPFVDCQDSNPYAVCCHEPLTGFVAHLHHDGDPRLFCRTISRFLELTEKEFRHKGRELWMENLKGDFEHERVERTPDDARVGKDLTDVVTAIDRADDGRTTLLMFASQLFGPGDEDDLDRLLSLGDEYVRWSVLERCRHLGTSTAQLLVEREEREYDNFIANLAEALKAAEIRVEWMSKKSYDWRVMPGNIGLNFAALFARRREPRFLDDLIQRVRGWIAQ